MNGATNPLKAMRVDVTQVDGQDASTKYTISNMNRFPKRVRVFDKSNITCLFLGVKSSITAYRRIQIGRNSKIEININN